MMKPILLVVILLAFAACQMNTATSPATTETLPEATDEGGEWTSVTAEGVELSIRTPPDWKSITDDHGILLAEHVRPNEVQRPDGVLVYIFVPRMHDIDINNFEAPNKAWAALNHVAQNRELVGHSTVTSTVAFEWGEHDAAYYLLTDGEGNHTIVIALVVPVINKMVVCNISSPAEDAARIRAVLPEVLSQLSVNGVLMDSSALASLPDPLPFPVHREVGYSDAAQSTDEP